MNIEYSVSAQDYIDYQLFIHSKSKHLIRKRRAQQVRLPVLYFLLGGFLLYFGLDIQGGFLLIKPGSTATGLFLVLTSLLWYFLWPVYTRRHYRKHYEKQILETYKEAIGSTSRVQFED